MRSFGFLAATNAESLTTQVVAIFGAISSNSCRHSWRGCNSYKSKMPRRVCDSLAHAMKGIRFRLVRLETGNDSFLNKVIGQKIALLRRMTKAVFLW